MGDKKIYFTALEVAKILGQSQILWERQSHSVVILKHTPALTGTSGNAVRFLAPLAQKPKNSHCPARIFID